MTGSWQKSLTFQEEPVAQAPNLSFPRGACGTGTNLSMHLASPHAQMSWEVAGQPLACCRMQGWHSLTVQELGALRVAFLHLLALVRGRLHVTVGHGKDSCPRLHQELAHLHIIAGCCTVQRGPARQGQKDGTSLPSSWHAQSPGSTWCLRELSNQPCPAQGFPAQHLNQHGKHKCFPQVIGATESCLSPKAKFPYRSPVILPFYNLLLFWEHSLRH